MVRTRALARLRPGPFKAALLALLFANTAYFVVFGTAPEAIDSCAWLALFTLFVAETDFARRLAGTRAKLAVRTLRLIAATGVIAATLGYAFEDNALDAVNSTLWIAVVVMLEVELRFPGFAGRHRAVFAGAAFALYGGLAVLVAMWALRGMWVDAYDAALWLTAFATVELAILRRT